MHFFLTIIAFIFGIAWVIGGILAIRTNKMKKNSPLLTTNAKVFAKTTKTSGGGTSYIGDGQFSTDSVVTEHFVSFEFNGRRESVKVDVSLFNTLGEGDMGILEYKEYVDVFNDNNGNFHFVSFERQT
jgi:hypothetical protein